MSITCPNCQYANSETMTRVKSREVVKRMECAKCRRPLFSDKGPTVRFEGYHEPSELPIKSGDMVLIRKGTLIRSTDPKQKERFAGSNHRIRVDHVLCGATKTELRQSNEPPYEFIEVRTPLKNPSIRWPNHDKWWQEVDINDLPEVQLAPEKKTG